MLHLQTPVDDIVRKIPAHPVILRAGFDKSQYDLLALDGDTQGDDDLVVRKALAVDKYGQDVLPSNPAPGIP